MKSQMKSADRSGAAYAVIFGSDELEAGVVTLRPLRDHQPQHTIRRDLVVTTIAALLSEHTLMPEELQ